MSAPIFLVSPPRSSARLLFDALAQSPDVVTRGDGASSPLDAVPELEPRNRGFRSNRLTLADVTASLADAVRERYHADGNRRPLDATPRHALRVSFLAAIFPDAQFVYVYRDPLETMRDMLEAWRSGRFVTYPDLPEWSGPPWSLLLVPAWHELRGLAPAQIVARQWATATSILLDDLERLPAGRWAVTSEERMAEDFPRICRFLGVGQAPPPVLPQVPTGGGVCPTHWSEVAHPIAARARELFAHAPSEPAAPAKPSAFRSVATSSFARILARLGVSLIVTTYQSGRVVLVRAQSESTLNTHFRMFRSPMGVAVGAHRLALGTEREVWEYRDMPAVAQKLQPPGAHDACFLPRNLHVTGDMRIHEIGYAAGGELWIVNTRFSALCTLDRQHSFVPRWVPPFITQLAAEDRCHLNGMAMVDGAVQYVTALAETNEAGAWRQHKAAGGVVMEVPSGRVIVRGLSMPHSPRVHDGRLWYLESGKGELNVDGRTVAQLPGFTRGLAFAGSFAFVGLSQVRESNVFGGIPLVDRVQDRRCGVWAIDLRSGETAAFLQFEGDVREIFDVQVLPARYPELLELGDDLVSVSYALPG
jgi:uncharacterized protein (TIGR03032 family)